MLVEALIKAIMRNGGGDGLDTFDDGENEANEMGGGPNMDLGGPLGDGTGG